MLEAVRLTQDKNHIKLPQRTPSHLKLRQKEKGNLFFSLLGEERFKMLKNQERDDPANIQNDASNQPIFSRCRTHGPRDRHRPSSRQKEEASWQCR